MSKPRLVVAELLNWVLSSIINSSTYLRCSCTVLKMWVPYFLRKMAYLEELARYVGC